ncbi:MAG: hypothetical protein QOG28_5704 [Trebonia sp.]|nr:hypothetical protein [Trebonia sp.]
MTGGLFYFVVMRRRFAGFSPAMTRDHGRGRPGAPQGTGGPQGTGPATGRHAGRQGRGITSRTQTAANAGLLPAGLLRVKKFRDKNSFRTNATGGAVEYRANQAYRATKGGDDRGPRGTGATGNGGLAGAGRDARTDRYLQKKLISV